MAKVNISKRPAQYTVVLTLSEEEAQDQRDYLGAKLALGGEFTLNGTNFVTDELDEKLFEALVNVTPVPDES